ncbi:hypothetical protein Tco_0026115 [Tanacetum coccineum]
MNTTKEQQKELDDALVAPENRLKIGKSNLRLSSNLKSKEPTIQVVLDALKLTPFYNAFEISADVPEIYMQEFWVTVTRHHSSLRFKLDGKSHTVNVDNFRDMLKICPKLPGQKFEEPPLEEDILSFIRDLGHTGEIKFLSDVNVNHMHQPWRSFAAIINKCLSGKTTALESLRLSRAQILWGMYHNKQVDYVYLLWEDLVFQVENKNSKKNNDMYYPRFTKVIVDYFMAKDQAIPRRNKMFWHYARDDFMFTTIRVISKHKDTQEYGAILPQHLTNQAMLESEAFKTYRAYATGEKAPKSKATKKKTDSESSPKTKPSQASKGKRIKTSAKGDKPATTKSKGLTVLSEVALFEVLDEQQQTGSGTNEGAGDKPEVPDVLEYRSESEEESWTFSQGEEEEEDDDDEHNNDEDDDEHDKDEDYVMGGEQEDEENEELYTDLNINLNKRDAEMTDAQVNLETGKVHVTIDSILNLNAAVSVTPSFATIIPQTPIPIIQPQQQTHDSTTTTTIPTTIVPKIPNFASLFGFKRKVSSLESDLSKLKQSNQFAKALSSITGIVDKYLATKVKDTVDVAVQLKSDKLREEAQAENQDFLNSLNSNVKRIIMESDVQKNLYRVLLEVYNSDKVLLSSYGKVVTLKRGCNDQEKDEEPSIGSNQGSKRQRSGKEESSKEVTQKKLKSTSSFKGTTRSPPKSSGKSVQEKEHDPRVDDLEEPFHQEFDTGNDDVSPIREATDVDERLWNPSGSRTPD